MRRFHLLVGGDAPASPLRIEIDAEDPDQAICLAENYSRHGDVELWEGDRLIAQMDGNTPRLWKIGSRPEQQFPQPRVDARTP